MHLGLQHKQTSVESGRNYTFVSLLTHPCMFYENPICMCVDTFVDTVHGRVFYALNQLNVLGVLVIRMLRNIYADSINSK